MPLKVKTFGGSCVIVDKADPALKYSETNNYSFIFDTKKDQLYKLSG